MDRSVVPPLVSLLSIFLILASPAAAQSTGTVTGRVTDAETGRSGGSKDEKNSEKGYEG